MHYHVDGGGTVRDAKGAVVRDPAVRSYIASLKIPPAYTHVRIFDPATQPKVLACGKDAKGRSQCIYNPVFIEERKKARFAKVQQLHAVFRRVRRTASREVRSFAPGMELTKERVVCMVIHLMLSCNFRIGSDRYVDENGSYGLTTLEWRHVEMLPKGVRIQFVGKKGVVNEEVCKRPAVRAFLEELAKVTRTSPTARVFRFPDAASGALHPIRSQMVNRWLRHFHPDITAKDLRTWQANRLFARFLLQGDPESTALKKVAHKLHHTPTVCKNNYIEPTLLKKARTGAPSHDP